MNSSLSITCKSKSKTKPNYNLQHSTNYPESERRARDFEALIYSIYDIYLYTYENLGMYRVRFEIGKTLVGW